MALDDRSAASTDSGGLRSRLRGQPAGSQASPPDASAAQGHDDDAWVYTTEVPDPNDPLLAWGRWRDALREIAEHDYLDGDECRRIAKEALA